MTHRRRRTNGFVRRLRLLLLLICIRLIGQVGRTEFFADVFANFLKRLGRDPGRIGTHVGDQSYRALFTELHAFVQALRDHHRALHTETELARGILLQLAGGERRRCIAPALFLIDRPDNPLGLLQRSADLFCFLGVGNFNLLLALAQKARIECGRLAGGQMCVDGPVFDFLERLDFAFALDDQAQGDGLHSSSGKSAADLIPK